MKEQERERTGTFSTNTSNKLFTPPCEKELLTYIHVPV